MIAPDPARAPPGCGRRRGGLLPLVFFLLVATLFPFAVGPDGPLLARTGGGALWIAALLAALLPVDRLVEPDRAARRARSARISRASARRRSPPPNWSATG